MTDFRRPEDSILDEGRAETTDIDEAIHEGATVDILTEDKTRIHKLETALETYKGEILAEQWERLKETKVDAYLKVVAERIGLLSNHTSMTSSTLARMGGCCISRTVHV